MILWRRSPAAVLSSGPYAGSAFFGARGRGGGGPAGSASRRGAGAAATSAAGAASAARIGRLCVARPLSPSTYQPRWLSTDAHKYVQIYTQTHDTKVVTSHACIQTYIQTHTYVRTRKYIQTDMHASIKGAVHKDAVHKSIIVWTVLSQGMGWPTGGGC